ncbi:MAG: cytochrome-c peroxidase [Chitinophagaceae bacterium]|nr:cytochrome-c peroxidase [Chitinophagaceae bacterium]
MIATTTRFVAAGALICCSLLACKKDATTSGSSSTETYPSVAATFAGRINLANLDNYAGQTVPAYISKNNAPGFAISNAKATLGRVLFYDKQLSIDNSISCGSCHQQSLAFSDTFMASKGVENGRTARHSMRLINVRFGNEAKFFWDERAANLEAQTTQPIKDHAEMGFSGSSGRPAFSSLISKLQALAYYQELFKFVYGDATVSEMRIQEALSHFIRSIQSFDSKYDAGRSQVPNDAQPFPNFTALENQGKQLFLQPPVFNPNGVRTAGGAGCQGCHAAPEFDIDPNSRNNGVIGKIGGGNDVAVTRSPSLRDVVKADGTANGPFMHIGLSNQLMTVIDHYNSINTAGNNNLDPRLMPGGQPQQLQLTANEKNALVAFIRTLGGNDVYTNARWSSPF